MTDRNDGDIINDMGQEEKVSFQKDKSLEEKPKCIEKLIHILFGQKERLKKEYKIKSLKISGSYIESRQTLKSDIDLLVEFYETPTLIEFIRIKNELSKLLGIKVKV